MSTYIKAVFFEQGNGFAHIVIYEEAAVINCRVGGTDFCFRYKVFVMVSLVFVLAHCCVVTVIVIDYILSVCIVCLFVSNIENADGAFCVHISLVKAHFCKVVVKSLHKSVIVIKYRCVVT